MPDLIAKLEKLEGADPHVDELIWEAIGGWPERKWRSVDYMRLYGTPLTASLDAAAALVERVLPGYGHGYRMNLSNKRFEANVYAPYWWTGEGPQVDEYGAAPSPALAMCLALLRAKEAQDGN